MTEQAAPLRLEGVDFRYDRQPVLSGFNLTLQRGEITLLAAPNGTGKTTVLWLAAGLLNPQRGQLQVLGANPFTERSVLGRVGFLAEGAPLPSGWTGQRVLDFQRQTFPHWQQVECDRLVQRLKLDLSMKIQTLSRGQRGKLALAAVLATQPELLLLDEPTLGLDVATRRLLHSELLGRLADDGVAILIATNDVDGYERFADRFILMGEGQVSCDEPVAALLERHRLLAWEEGVPTPPEVLQPVSLPERLTQRALARQWDSRHAERWLAAGGEEAPADLESIYLSLTDELEFV